MSPQRVACFFGALFFVGVLAGALLHQMIKPTEEQVRLAKINKDIQVEVCVRLGNDLSDFEAAPHTYKRTALSAIYSESIVTVKATSLAVDKDESIEFLGEPREIVSRCEEVAKRWVKIPAYFPEFYEDEYFVIFGEQVSEDAIGLGAEYGNRESSGKRVALVIGNSRYQDRPLKNPANDARDIGEVLRNSGFDVLEYHDLDAIRLRKVVEEFEESVFEYSAALLYYSGHGMEMGGRNFLIPIDASINSEEEIPRQGLDVTTVVEKIGRANIGTAIFVIDACRNTPIFSKLRGADSGLAAMQTAGGSLIAYSAAPGQIALDGDGRNSPYTKALIRELLVPRKRVEDILKDTAKAVTKETAGRQTPWYNSSLTGDFYFIE